MWTRSSTQLAPRSSPSYVGAISLHSLRVSLTVAASQDEEGYEHALTIARLEHELAEIEKCVVPRCHCSMCWVCWVVSGAAPFSLPQNVAKETGKHSGKSTNAEQARSDHRPTHQRPRCADQIQARDQDEIRRGGIVPR
jgi:hypothetical protein